MPYRAIGHEVDEYGNLQPENARGRDRDDPFHLGGEMLLAAFYVFAILCIILYYTGHLKRWNSEWILIVLAVAVFPAVLYL
jgi:hypothetical protein